MMLQTRLSGASRGKGLRKLLYEGHVYRYLGCMHEIGEMLHSFDDCKVGRLEKEEPC